VRTVSILTALTFGVATTALGDPRATEVERFETAAPAIRALLEKGTVTDRRDALVRAGRIPDARAFELVLDAITKEEGRRAAIAKTHTETGLALQAAITEVDRINEKNPTTPREMEAHNAQVERVETKRDGAYGRLRALSLEAAGQLEVFRAGTTALAHVLSGLPVDVARGLTERLVSSWTSSRSTDTDRIRLVDVLADVASEEAAGRLVRFARDTDADLALRVAALAAAVARRHPDALDACVASLADPVDRWPLLAEAIEGLRRTHRREAIEPLIAFLDRPQIGRLREDAHHALVSLTQQAHGPYARPWSDWWATAKATFALPPAPMEVHEIWRKEVATRDEYGANLAFYGLPTFSERLVFVLDVSASMLDPAHPDAKGARSEERRIDLAKKEITSALSMLEPTKTFEIVFFSHKVQRLVGLLAPATPAIVARASTVARAFEPTGGTNIHDALETAFQAAGRPTSPVSGRTSSPAADTVFFMTDGTPTAGKHQAPEAILAIVRHWNRTARLTIHTIAVGDRCDERFLEALARENGGRFVKR
jgi:hypothetical protein